MTKFREEDHPRDADGKFTDKSTPAEKKKLEKMGISLKENQRNKNLTKEEMRLNEIIGEKLTQEKNNDRIEKESEVVQAKSIEEAEKYAKEKLGLESNYKGIAVEVANEMNAAFKRGIDICPAIKDKLKMVGSGQKANKALKAELIHYFEQEYRKEYPNSTTDWYTKMAKKSAKLPSISTYDLAHAQEYSSINPTINAILQKYNGIYVNEKHGKNKEELINSLKRNTQSGFHPIGCDTISSIFDHEVAHVLDNVLKLKTNAEIQNLFRKYSKQEIEQGLSRYAIRENKIGEFIAEGWAEFCNNPKPRKIATEIAEIIKKEIKKK